MAQMVCMGALLKCPFGSVPTPLTVLPQNKVTGNLPYANMNDHIPLANILPFGMCNNPANPMVIAATAAALGVLTPVPCIPATSAPWTGTNEKVQIGGVDSVTSDSSLMCMWGGEIKVDFAGQVQVMC